MGKTAKLISVCAALTLLATVAVYGTALGGNKPQCFGKQATIVGTSDDDTLDGTGNNDVIVGQGR